MRKIENQEQYEKAKTLFRDNGSLHAERLKSMLLEYRREHNIFDVGDKVVHDEFKSVGAFERSIGSSNRLASINYGLGGITTLIKSLRHATDSEIKAGHRL